MEGAITSATDRLLPLRTWPKDDQSPIKSIASFIGRINEQRGQFRNVTEAGLEEEIRRLQAKKADDTLKDPEEDDEDVDDQEEEDQNDRKIDDEPGRRESLVKAKEEILKQVGCVQPLPFPFDSTGISLTWRSIDKHIWKHIMHWISSPYCYPRTCPVKRSCPCPNISSSMPPWPP